LVQLNSVEIAALVAEIGPTVRDAYVKNVYQTRPKELIFKLYKPGHGAYELWIVAGSCMFLTEGSTSKPERPPEKIMSLRQFTVNKRIVDVRQLGGERIVEIIFDDEEMEVVAELMPPGNIILIVKGIVEWTLESFESDKRVVRKGITYVPPPPRFSLQPSEFSPTVFARLNPNSSLVSTLSRDLGLGGKYAEEVIKRASLDKRMKASTLDEEGKKRLYEALTQLLKEEKTVPRLYTKKSEAVPSLIQLKTFDDTPFIETSSFSEAVMLSYFKEIEQQSLQEAMKLIEEKIMALDKEKSDRLHTLEEIKSKKARIESLIEKIQPITYFAEELWSSPENTVKRLKELTGLDVFFDDGAFVIRFEDLSLVLKGGSSVHKELGKLYDEVKVLKRTIMKLEEDVARIDEEIAKALSEKEKIRPETILVVKKERLVRKPFRIFTTSTGFKVLVGKDASSNTALLKKHLGVKDLVFHTEFPGSPATVLVNGSEAGPEDLEEAAQITASYSKAWKEMFSNASVYYVKAEQVSFSPPSGQYLPKGSFMVYGKKNFLTVDLKLAIAAEDDSLEIMAYLTAKRRISRFVEIRPGRVKSLEAAEISAKLLGASPSHEALVALASTIPYGRCSIFYQDKLIKG